MAVLIDCFVSASKAAEKAEADSLLASARANQLVRAKSHSPRYCKPAPPIDLAQGANTPVCCQLFFLFFFSSAQKPSGPCHVSHHVMVIECSFGKIIGFRLTKRIACITENKRFVPGLSLSSFQ